MMTEKSSSVSCEEVMDGSKLMKLVENEKVFGNFVDHKFEQLDVDCDGKLSVKELEPAVADIGAALGLPAQGSSPESDHIYSEVLNEFTRGKQKKINKTEFKGVFTDILLGMAAGLKRDPIVILRIDGNELREFIGGSAIEPELISIYSEVQSSEGSLKDYIIKAFEKLSVDQGMPPATDPWVMSNIVEPALLSLEPVLDQPVSQETFLSGFMRVAERVIQLLEEKPAIVAHSQNTFDGSGIRRLLSNKFEFDKMLDTALKGIVPRDKHGKISKEHLIAALDSVAASAGLPPLGAVDEIDGIMTEALKTFDAGDGKTVKEEEFRKLIAEVLGSIMLQLEGCPVSVSVNSVVHEPVESSSTLLQPSSP